MKKIMVFGTFDLLHPGHVSFLKQAKKFACPQRQQAGLRGGRGTFLVVSVARDVNVKRVKKHLPIFNEKKRLQHVKNLKIANKVMLAGLKDPWPHIKKEKPDVIALGYDQRPYISKQITDNSLEAELQKHGLKTKVIRLRPFRPEVFKSSILRKKR